MTHEDWYDHMSLGKVMAVSDYVKLVLLGDVETEMSRTSMLLLQDLLAALQNDIDMRIDKRNNSAGHECE